MKTLVAIILSVVIYAVLGGGILGAAAPMVQKHQQQIELAAE